MTLALLSVLALIAVGWAGAHLPVLTGVAVPYAALIIFLAGFIYRLIVWASSPVPFHIPTVCGQERSLSWIKSSTIDSPSTRTGVFVRMALEVLLFRSLWQNDRMELKRHEKLIYGSNRYLWLSGLLFHWSLLFILFRHLRLFTVPVLPGIASIDSLDGFFRLGDPVFYMSDLFIILGLAFLLGRRFIPRVRMISLPQDYFALFLLIAVVLSGALMRHIFKTDVERVKELCISIVSLRPVVPPGLGAPFYIHLFLVCVLFAWFPFSKLMHAPGVFLSPTRNLRNDSRARRHVNPWSYPVKVHTYAEYEEEFGGAMEAAGLPVEKEVKVDG
jgi:nitrate reductase gamma subunit